MLMVDNEICLSIPFSEIPLSFSFKNKVRKTLFCIVGGKKEEAITIKCCQLVGLCSGINLDI